MDKISGIIPSSPRVTNVDMKDATPVRSGTPTFGRPEHVVRPPAKEVAMSSPHSSAAAKGDSAPPPEWRARDQAQAAMAAKVSENFFGHSAVEAKESDDDNDGVREGSTRISGNSPAQNSSQIPSQARTGRALERTPVPATFKTDEAESLRAAQMRPFDSFGHDEQEESVEEMPRLKQPEGLYPKGSFIDRSA